MRLRIASPAPAPARRVGPQPHARRSLGWSVFWLLIAIFAGIVAGPAIASSDRIDVEQAAFEARDDGVYFNGDFDFELKSRVAEALDRGLTLYFVVEAELTRARWYWFDEQTATAVLTYRLSYHALTRQYRVSTGNLQLGFPTLADAIGVMAHVRDWKVAERDAFKPGQKYDAAVRMRLDKTQLPKPFQINAIANRDWTLESDWKRLVVEPH